ncbi:uncharacterized protein ALTATR162_LOCUS5707 [Alternaria atra]|uniref:Uncharacterized protein n=1 Tax=Alternaria atra TaxID=119953 RepID=A0A8J2I2H3_9PLEO|nr:uncharacterized protein ALTATR162_LOCUS5707 [Alternaria atra]CAG5159957.1 unnamed protein product [Alternaria atra]
MAISTHALSQIRQYSTRGLPRDPHYRLKATLATSYVVSALALPFVPPLLETRRAKADGSYLTSISDARDEAISLISDFFSFHYSTLAAHKFRTISSYIPGVPSLSAGLTYKH